jgi:hypothetical protein
LKKDLEPLMIRKMSRHFGILKKWRISISIQCENGHQKKKVKDINFKNWFRKYVHKFSCFFVVCPLV